MVNKDRILLMDQLSIYETDVSGFSDQLPQVLNKVNMMDLETIAMLNENQHYNLALTFKNEV